MQELWARLEAWAQANAGKSLRLRPGADEAAIQAAEQRLGLQFPADYRASLLAHDGQEGNDDVFEWLPGCSPLKPLSAVLERWAEEQSLAEEFPDDRTEGPLHLVLWHPRRIPIAGNTWWDGDNTYVDLHPSPSGTSGQITTFVTECDLECLGSSLRDALEQYLKALEMGTWVYSPAKGHVMPSDEPRDEHPNESAEFARYLRNERPTDDDDQEATVVERPAAKRLAAAKQPSAKKAAKPPLKKPTKKLARKPTKQPPLKQPLKQPTKKPPLKKPPLKKPPKKPAKKPPSRPKPRRK